MAKYIFLIILCFLMVQFVVRFLIPVISGVLTMKRKMKEMQDFQQGRDPRQPHNSQQANGSDPTGGTTRKAPVQKDYIDFEEIKE
ncbi:hypothetical protein EXU57_15975 [Segetibacter sp. 3557_3]|uniref:hypothetical protein n=1 Tax=Segetibacter sp. 3557_3 TaxID=2547429 RepID=UPI00105883C6|nr:hypothetical protein [Segetibacter sp. 3557_3]TDH23986.1 hypothetical protein EXU57_15975 [Segetibacter sp. 3557_3]